MTATGHDSRSHSRWRQSASADSSSKLEYSKWQSGSSHYEELLCQWACSQTADLSAGTVIAATTQQDCRRCVTAVKVRAMDGRAKASRDQERSRAVRRVPRRPSGGRAGSSSAPQPPKELAGAAIGRRWGSIFVRWGHHLRSPGDPASPHTPAGSECRTLGSPDPLLLTLRPMPVALRGIDLVCDNSRGVLVVVAVRRQRQ